MTSFSAESKKVLVSLSINSVTKRKPESAGNNLKPGPIHFEPERSSVLLGSLPDDKHDLTDLQGQ